MPVTINGSTGVFGNLTGALSGNALTSTAAASLTSATGSAPVFGCRAWVNFDGTRDTTGATSTDNTNRLIRASGNVQSVLRNSTGTYTITFTVPMPDSNYALVTMGHTFDTGTTDQRVLGWDQGNIYTASAVQVTNRQYSGLGFLDTSNVSIAIFR